MDPRVSQSQEITLCKQAQAGCQESKDKMITHNLGLVKKVANKMNFANTRCTDEDLIQEGVFGLVRAIEKFDSTKGCRFSTYAYNWIRAYVGRYNMNNRGDIRVPSHLITRLRNAEEGSEEYNQLMEKMPRTVSIHSQVGDSSVLEDIIPDETEAPDIDYEIVLDQVEELLTPREYQVVCLRYGLEDNDVHTHRECAQLFGVSHTTIWNEEKKALVKLQEHFTK